MGRYFTYSRTRGIICHVAAWLLAFSVACTFAGQTEAQPMGSPLDWSEKFDRYGFPSVIATICLWVIVVSLKEFTKSQYEVAKALNGLEKEVAHAAIGRDGAAQRLDATLQRIEVFLYRAADREK